MMAGSSTSCWISGALQQVAQSVRWSYSLFWHLCPHQGVLVWGDGYYNGAIKTRKTVLHQPAGKEITMEQQQQAEDAALHRSHQLRDLYQSLLLSGSSATPSGEYTNPRRACAALSPEDLTESEWFYLMSASFSFAPGVGLPGKAFETRRHVWLTRANEVGSKVFSRAILAKSAKIQTVVCIPVADGVLELGTTEKVEEDIGLVQHARSFFINHHQYHLKPALSEHSSSNPSLFHSSIGSIPQPCNEEECNDDDEDDEEAEAEGSDDDTQENREEEVNPIVVEPAEMMQIEMSESIRLGSPDDCSNNIQQNDPFEAWNLFQEKFCDNIPPSSGFASVAQMQEMPQQDAHYSETVSAILQYNMRKLSTDSSCFFSPTQLSAFTTANHIETQQRLIAKSGAPQQMLKCVLFTVPNLSSNFKCGGRDEKSPRAKDRDDEGSNACKFQRGTPQEDLSANHVLAERRRREKLNERFIILRSLVPYVTKMDKASILGDTIEYVKQLRKRIQDLESQDKQMESYSLRASSMEDLAAQTPSGWAEKKRKRVTEDRNVSSKGSRVVQVSIIESDALLELQCSYREGMLLKIMNKLHDLMLEITSIQSSTCNGVFVAEIKAKVKEVLGRKTSIAEVKKAVCQIFP